MTSAKTIIEAPTRIEPARLEQAPEKITNLVAELSRAIASAHHRLSYIHPFPDGNGRVARLMSHAMGLRAGVGAHGLW